MAAMATWGVPLVNKVAILKNESNISARTHNMANLVTALVDLSNRERLGIVAALSKPNATRIQKFPRLVFDLFGYYGRLHQTRTVYKHIQRMLETFTRVHLSFVS